MSVGVIYMYWLSSIKYIDHNYDPLFIMDSYKITSLSGVQVKKITDKNHPVYQQYGLFATKKWKPYQIIGEYTGIITNKYINSDYLASLSNIIMSLGINAEKMGNELRFINHYKNIKNNPNCKFEQSYISGKPILLIVVTDYINKNDEILIDYLYDI